MKSVQTARHAERKKDSSLEFSFSLSDNRQTDRQTNKTDRQTDRQRDRVSTAVTTESDLRWLKNSEKVSGACVRASAAAQ